jgi:TolA-binding protein
MSEERRGGGFFSRMFTPQDDETSVFRMDEIEAPEPESSVGSSRGFGVERAVSIIDDLPQDVSRASAVRIVRQTLEAAGISIDELGSSARAREAKLESEIQLSRDRIDELKERTDEVVRDLEVQIRKAREARDFGVSQEERKVSAARAGLGDVEKVRDFFSLRSAEDTPVEGIPIAGSQDNAALPEAEESRDEQTVSDADDTQILRPVNVDDTRVMRPRGPLSRDWDPEADTESDER